MGVGVLGPLEVDEGRVRLGARDRIVLAALAMRAGEVLAPERIADAVWGDTVPSTWNKALQGCVSRLRKHLGREAIETLPQGYRLVLPPDAVDAWRFERLVARAQELLTLREPERAGFVAGQALQLWRGRPLTELEEWEPGVLEAARLLELRLGAEELQLDAALQAGRHREVLAQAQVLVDSAPVRERRWTLLALAQYQSGRQTEALRTLHRLRRMLAEELGLDPAPEAIALEQAILRQDPSLVVEAAPRAESESCPYLGLTPYDENDAESFFGREQEIAECLRRLSENGVLAVVGPSGSGKSSLVRAGVAVALRRGGRLVTVVAPGRNPMDALAGPLGFARRPALVVDQAEEVFSVCDDPAERKRFLDALTEYAESAPVVVSLRADRTGDVAAYPAFARLLERGLFLLGAMSADSLRAAVQGPARQAGLVVEPGLVDLLVREVEGEPGALPLLSHALRETWLRREGRTLTVAGYQASGGIRGAVAQSAEELYAKVPEEEQDLLKDILLRLVAPGPAGEPVRARMPRRVVVADPVQDPLIDLLVSARLVTSDDGVVEIAHESLARAWPRLRGWLDDDIEGRRILHHLVAAADSWDALGRPDSELYRGVRLTQVLAWRDAARPELTPVERDFLDAGLDAADAEARAAQERTRQQGVMIRRLRGTLGGAAILLVLALVAGLLAVRQADRAEGAATAESARRVGARALVIEEPSEALLLAAAGVRLDRSADTHGSLLGVLGRFPRLVDSMPMVGQEEVARLAVHPTNGTVATYDVVHHVRLYDLESGELLAEHQAGRRRPEWTWEGRIAFSPDGTRLAVTTGLPSRRPVELLDASTLEPLPGQPAGLPRRPWQSIFVAFDGDGSHLAVVAEPVRGDGRDVAAPQRVAAVWRLADLRRPRVRPVGVGTWSVALTEDGSALYTNDPLGWIDLSTGSRTDFTLDGFRPLGGVTLSPDGGQLAVAEAQDGGRIAVLDARTGVELARLVPEDDEPVWEARFTHGGSRIVTVTYPRRVTRIWDVATKVTIAEIDQEDGQDLAYDLNPDGTTMYAAANSGMLRGYDLTGERHLVREIHRSDGVPSGFADVAPGGRRVTFVGTLEGGAPGDRRWFLDVRSGTTIGPFEHRGYSLSGGSWTPDGERFASAVGGTIRSWDAATGEVIRTAKPGGEEVTLVDHSPDGSMLAMSELGGTVTRLDADTLAPSGTPVRVDGGAGFVSLGPDNRTALVLGGMPTDTPTLYFDLPTTWQLVDLEEGEVLVDPREIGFRALYGGIAPDGRHAVISGYNGEVLVIEVGTGRPVRPAVRADPGGIFIFKFSADGNRIITSSTNGYVTIWDTASGVPQLTAAAPGRPYVSAELADEHTVLISEWGGKAAWTWDTRLGPALELACKAAGRDLTEQEWADNFGDRPYDATCPRG